MKRNMLVVAGLVGLLGMGPGVRGMNGKMDVLGILEKKIETLLAAQNQEEEIKKRRESLGELISKELLQKLEDTGVSELLSENTVLRGLDIVVEEQYRPVIVDNFLQKVRKLRHRENVLAMAKRLLAALDRPKRRRSLHKKKAPDLVVVDILHNFLKRILRLIKEESSSNAHDRVNFACDCLACLLTRAEYEEEFQKEMNRAILACSHAFCTKCVNAAQQDASVICPVCQEQQAIIEAEIVSVRVCLGGNCVIL